MIYLVDHRNRDEFSAQLEEMYRIRHRVYVDKRGWKDLTQEDKREVDQFDNEDALYLLRLDDEGRVSAGIRLIPTTKPHLMRDVFPHIVTWGRIPNSEQVYEITRYFVSDDITDMNEINKASGALLIALFEYGFAKGLTHYSVVCDTFFLPSLLNLDPGTHPLGLPTPYDEGVCVAVMFPITEPAVAGLRQRRGIPEQVLAFSMTPPPYAVPDVRRIAA